MLLKDGGFEFLPIKEAVEQELLKPVSSRPASLCHREHQENHQEERDSLEEVGNIVDQICDRQSMGLLV
jgi:hypothetical protein